MTPLDGEPEVSLHSYPQTSAEARLKETHIYPLEASPSIIEVLPETSYPTARPPAEGCVLGSEAMDSR